MCPGDPGEAAGRPVDVSFYAPLKPPTHPVPSGDRTIARLLMRALAAAGARVELASRLRSWDGEGDPGRQRRIRARGERRARELIARLGARREPARPRLWFTYHAYHKAPDWLGPPVCDALGIPYVVAEASVAGRQRAGRWHIGHAATEAAVRRADAVLAMNRDDVAGLAPLVGDPSRIVGLAPFVDAGAYPRAADRAPARAGLAARLGLEPGTPWLLAVAMMRPGRKARCFDVLAAALERLGPRPWSLIIAGDGAAREGIEARFRSFPGGRVRLVGRQAARDLRILYAASDVFVWPALGEPLGMAMLEAQASGLPVVAGRTRGVPDLVVDGETGLLPAEGDEAAFAGAVGTLLDHPARRREMGARARSRVARDHDIAAAARTLARLCRRLVTPAP